MRSSPFPGRYAPAAPAAPPRPAYPTARAGADATEVSRVTLDRDEPVLERVVHELGAGGQPDLLLDVRAVRLDRAHAQVQLPGDLRVRVAEGDQPEDLDLALGQVVGRAGGLGRRCRDAGAELRVQERAAARGGAHGLHELLVGGLLEDVAARPGLEGLARERGVLLHREDDDLRAGRLLAEDGDRRQAGIAGHVEV